VVQELLHFFLKSLPTLNDRPFAKPPFMLISQILVPRLLFQENFAEN
jgi:hypothetical protein